jgi:hypothetical protein
VLHYNCGLWFPDTAWDDELVPPATGIYDIYLAENTSPPGASFPPDSSYNVVFSPAPSFTLGTNLGVVFGVQVQNLADTAVAALHFRDGAGNEYDTTLVYIPPKILVNPKFINVGSIREQDSAKGFIVITDSGNAPTIFTVFRLAVGKHWKILNPPGIPLTINPGVSDTFYFQYNAPISGTFECDPDTLLVNTCKQFPIAEMIGCTKKPAIQSYDYNFNCQTIDTLGLGGDTVYSPKTKYGVYIASIGTDTLHLTGATLAPIPGNIPNPAADFAIISYYDKAKADTTSLPIAMPPGDTVFVIVRGHPTISSPNIQAQILYTDDANHYQRDTSILTICGLAPGIFTQSVDYGTHLYATTKDSFVIVRNTGTSPVFVEMFSPLGPDSTNFNAYPFGKGYIDPTSRKYIQFPIDSITYNPADEYQYPYRFVSRKLGANLDSMLLATDLIGQHIVIDLTGNVIEPQITGEGSCPNDSVFVGSTGTQVVTIGNTGTDVMTIDTINIASATGDAPEWQIVSPIIDSNIVTTTTQPVAWPPPPFAQLAPGHVWLVTLQFKPIHVGPSTGTVHLAGYDALGRHSNDSLNSITYSWGRMPYDTTVSICNSAFSQGVKAIGMDVGMQYLGLQKNGRIAVVDTGKGEIIIQDVFTNDPDQTWILALGNGWTFPDTLQPGDTLWLDFTFAPSSGAGAGARHYQVKYTVVNSTGDTVFATAGGTGVIVSMYTHIDTSYSTLPGQPCIVWLALDSLKDPIGNANIHGFVMEMSHYNRSVVLLNKAYNIGGVGTPGQVGTLSSGSTVTDNTADDSVHTHGSQAYFEPIVQGIPNQIETGGILLNMQFTGLIGPDTSQLVYSIPSVYDDQGNGLSYVQTFSSPGAIRVDSICGLNLSKISYTGKSALAQNSPNPVNQSTDIVFSLPGETHAVMTITNSIGQVVATPVDQDLSKGQYNVTFDASNLPTGLYYYSLRTSDGKVLRRQMMVVR